MMNRPAKVLIIDDDQITTETFARMLRLEGHEVRTALDAKTGLNEAYIEHPDAIIVDLRMPVMDGLGFVQRLRAQEHGNVTPVAMVTGDYSLSQSISTELEQLGVKVCFKPLWLDDLVKLATVLLSTRKPLAHPIVTH